MAFALPFVAVALLAVIYQLYRKLTRISVADIPGPEPESFILGKLFLLLAPILDTDNDILGNLRQYFHSQAGAVRSSNNLAL
jgi:hypothetical protein